MIVARCIVAFVSFCVLLSIVTVARIIYIILLMLLVYLDKIAVADDFCLTIDVVVLRLLVCLARLFEKIVYQQTPSITIKGERSQRRFANSCRSNGS